MGAPLENDRANQCVGCGPEDPMGLRLRFEHAEGGAMARLEVRPEHQGAPDRIHSALLYLAMTETANWSVYAELGRIGLPTSTSALETMRWVPIGDTLTFRRSWSPATNSVEVEATDASGRPVARLRRAFALPSRAEYMARLGYEELPAALEGLLPV